MDTFEMRYSRMLESVEGRYYRPCDVQMFEYLKNKEYWTTKKPGGAYYLNVPSAFDTETTSFETMIMGKFEKVGAMYEWSFGLDGYVVIGRTWDEYIKFVEDLHKVIGLDGSHRLLVFIENLGFDSQFFRTRFKWDSVFCKDAREPLTMLSCGIEYRCSYQLTSLSLEKIGESLNKYKFTKAVSDLDYQKLRHSETPLTGTELKYCIRDVVVIMAYIYECIEDEGMIWKIPLTATGYARRLVRRNCLYLSAEDAKAPQRAKNKALKSIEEYRALMKELTLSPREFLALRRALAGGHTHANAFYVNKTVEDVTSIDFTSAYIAAALAEKYPMSKGEEVDPTTIKSMRQMDQMSVYCGFVADVELYDVESSTIQDHFLSESKLQYEEDVVVDNGRVVSAKRLRVTITSVDWQLIRETYNIGGCRVMEMYRYKMSYLPKKYRQAFWDLYIKKTELKDVEGQEEFYRKAKALLNALFGMMVTNFAQADCDYIDGKYVKQTLNTIEAVERYNNDKSRFTSYPWGVFITAYNRRNLWSMIIECGDDYLYSDTDSGKILNIEKHQAYIDAYNAGITHKLQAACEACGETWVVPKTIEGKEKPLGVWDLDAKYKRFKTLGAKRYLVEEYCKDSNGRPSTRLKLTTSGVNKKSAMEYLVAKYKTADAIFDAFTWDLVIPAEYVELEDGTIRAATEQDRFEGKYKPHRASGRTTCAYFDSEYTCKLVDYLGNVATVHETSSVWLGEDSYTFGLAGEFSRYLEMLSTNTIEYGV